MYARQARQAATREKHQKTRGERRIRVADSTRRLQVRCFSSSLINSGDASDRKFGEIQRKVKKKKNRKKPGASEERVRFNV